MEINGLPLHPLVVHAVVVLAPLAALTALAYAVVPRWRWLLRWPLVVLAVLAMGGALVATLSGQSLLESRPGLSDLAAVATHKQAGLRLRWVMVGFTVVALTGAWFLGGPSALASGKGARPRSGRAEPVLAALLGLAALAVLVTVVLAGDSGARAVWG
ncbi:MAG TPA: hypothetical protein PLP61_04585 [Nocardioides sp.]|uniref:DUF2231 domain-containing protein n=1 Tax=Nocardioides sp. TaxID=35761 RepID=UPI002BB11D7F|nr:DUF2231 domain-containing protein [Nocardioides sp.]HQR26296.1 hypothetical protein [Nocardioides sp.]